MTPDALTMIVVTHPLQVLLIGMILVRGARAAISTAAEARHARRSQLRVA